ncbi:rhomboid family intramembrane serine protease [Nonomuraea sp. KC401]|uniref:Rhomboid family intramembrane serine protease n=2 Tax=Nonomuraea longispora TaxID=1848320 RepID=A0A4R4MNL9_9ACTN|nr:MULTISPECIES: rhomboid family intramembrane serine protease [unclassified Nonomuraea]NBE94593.1 rhomboid family intramembrane serine protease [Nonomuraea sp. K271]TDB96573.1 rhomboid family intramembrane serine protease [Nonomuraea longispora]TLF72661.1 rhomboid family intramembrane serine protease [Nonomuraea sp. KC401]
MSDYSGSRFDSARRGAGVLLSGALSMLIIMGVLLGVMWILEGVDVVLNGSLDQYGIVGWDPDGLVGILLAPFLHGGFGHLMANSLPLLILGFLAGLRDVGKFLWASLMIVLIGGLGTWVTSPGVVTIGASGLVFGYFGFILARGLFDRSLLDFAIAIGVGVAYWGILAGLLPNQPGISWQGHLFGLIGGVVAAWVLRRKREITTSPY